MSRYDSFKALASTAALVLTVVSAANAQTTQPAAAARTSANEATANDAAAAPAPSDALHFYIGLTGGTEHRAIGEDVNLGTAAEWGQGFLVSQNLGYRWDSGYRLEFEIGMQDNPNIGFYFPPYPNGGREESAGHVTLRSYMINSYYDFPVGKSKFHPFLGGGWGVTESRINGVTSKTLQSGIPGVFAATVLDTASRYTSAGQIRAGVDIQTSQRFGLFFNYKYYQSGQLNFKTVQFPDVQVRGAKINAFEGGIQVFLF